MNLSTATAKFENTKLALQSFFLIAQSAALFLPIALSFQHLPYLRYDVQGLFANCLGLVFCGLVLLFAAPSKPRWASWLVIFAIYLCIAALISGARFPQLESLSIWIYLLLLLLCGQAGGLKAYAIFGSICALIAIFQVHYPAMFAGWAFVPGDMSANYLAFFLILPLAATFSLAADSARNFGKILWLLLAGLVIAAIVSTDSRAVILGLLIAIPCWALTKARVSRPLLWSGILVLVLGMGLSILLIETSPEQLLTIFGDSAGGRLRRWINAWPMIRDHFWFGVGPGNWLPGYLPYQHSVVADARGYPAAFNSYLEIWGELGFVGLGLFAALILAILATWLNGDRKNKIIFGAVVAQLTAAAFHPVFSSELLAPSVMVALGLLSREELSPPQPSPCGWRLALGGMVLFLAAALPFRWTSLSAKLATYETEMGALPFFAQDPKEINWLRRALATWSLVSANSPQELGQFSSGRFRNFYGNFARREEESRGPAAAIPAWQRAVADFGNHPGNNEHLIHALRVSGDVKQARAIGDLAASRFQFQPALIAEYARALEQYFEYQAARLFYSKAQAAYQQLLGGDYFGKSGQAEKYFIEQGKKQVEERINYLDRLQKLPELDPALKAVIDTPVINKDLAIIDNEVYFSSNENGPVGLWKLGVNGQRASVSEENYSFFRLRADTEKRQLYFISDSGGNGKFGLFRLDLALGGISRLTSGKAGDSFGVYELSPDNKAIAVVRNREGGGSVLQLLANGNNESLELVRSPAEITEIAWNPKGNGLAFINGKREIHFVGVDQKLATALVKNSGAELSNIEVSPGGDQLSFISDAKLGWNELKIVNLTSPPHLAKTIFTGKIVGAQWLDQQQLLLRLENAGNYFLEKFNIATGERQAIGPRYGVVYRPKLTALRDQQAILAWHSDFLTPLELLRIPLQIGLAAEVLARVGEADQNTTIIPKRLEFSFEDKVFSAFLFAGKGDRAQAVVIWLHGSGDSFSPRYQAHTQLLAQAGYTVLALNYLGECRTEVSPCRENSAPGGQSERALSQLVAMLPQLVTAEVKRPLQIYLLGVSAGTALARQAVLKMPQTFSGQIEFSPASAAKNIGDAAAAVPKLVIRGENDPRFGGAGMPGTDVVVLGEGHDLHHAKNLETRIRWTLEFLEQHRLALAAGAAQ